MTDEAQSNDERDDLRFAAYVAELRRAMNLSQAELAARLREHGWPRVHQNTISRIEKGEQKVTVGQALVIAAALNVELTSMFTHGYSLESVRLEAARDAVERTLLIAAREYSNFLQARRSFKAELDQLMQNGGVQMDVYGSRVLGADATERGVPTRDAA